MTIVAKCDHDGPVRVVQDVGAERPIHATAVGKAIVAFLPAAELDGLLARITYERYTPQAPSCSAPRSKPSCAASARRAAPTTTRSTSRASAASRRRCGIYSGQVVASLCTLGPKSRMTRQRLRDLRAPLVALAAAISERPGRDARRRKRAADVA